MRIIDAKNTVLLGEILESTFPETLGADSGSVALNWPQNKVELATIFDIPVLSSQVRAPFLDRPILQQSCELCPVDVAPGEALDQTYQKRVSNVLGAPVSSSVKNTNKWHEVRSSTRWTVDDFSVFLSVYGSERATSDGISAAGLGFILLDEISVAGSFLQARQELEQSYWEKLDQYTPVFMVQTRNENNPFFLPDYEGGLVEFQKVSRLKRLSQKALYKRHLLETPGLVRTNIPGKGVLLWSFAGRDFLSVSCDTIELKDNLTPLEYIKIKPAKGSGGCYLHVGELTISDVFNSSVLENLTQVLEQRLQRKASRKEDYDV